LAGRLDRNDDGMNVIDETQSAIARAHRRMAAFHAGKARLRCGNRVAPDAAAP